MFLSQLELDLEPPLVRHSHDVTGLYTKICKPLSALDTTYSYIGTQVEVSRKLALGCWCHLERSPTGNGWDAILGCGFNLLPAWQPLRRLASKPSRA